MPTVSLPLISGTNTSVRPSRRPCATVTSRCVATRCFVPRRVASVAVSDGKPVVLSTTWMVAVSSASSPSMR